MKRRTFVRKMGMATAHNDFHSLLLIFCLILMVRKVKITDVQCVLTKIGFRVSPLVKISTDAGLVGIGECHHDENGHGAKDMS